MSTIAGSPRSSGGRAHILPGIVAVASDLRQSVSCIGNQLGVPMTTLGPATTAAADARIPAGRAPTPLAEAVAAATARQQ